MATGKVNRPIEVFLLAENRLLREALGRVLSKKHEMCVVAASAFHPQIVRSIAETQPDVLLLDSAVFACSDLKVVAAVRAEIPGVKVVMIGMETDKETFVRCVRSGISGYVLKDASAAEIAAAVRGVASDEAVCPPALCLALFEYLARQPQVSALQGKLQFGLTRREQQLVQMIGGGLSNKEIASQLNLSEQTIKNHIHRMLRKLGAGDRLAAVEVCRQEGLVA
jgi:two-component system, NarL family, response regulator DevR